MLRVLFDTNILICYLLVRRANSPIPRIVEAGLDGQFNLLLPEEIVLELAARVSSKPYLRDRISKRNLDELIDTLLPLSEMIPRLEYFPVITRDPKDDYLLAYAVVGQAGYLVTGDQDLLIIEEAEGVRMITPRGFLSIIDPH